VINGFYNKAGESTLVYSGVLFLFAILCFKKFLIKCFSSRELEKKFDTSKEVEFSIYELTFLKKEKKCFDCR